MAREQIPITPEVLRWARERANFSIEEARRKFRDIEAWEAGKGFPTYPQLERLSESFRVPLAVFFFPEPPAVPPIRESFRTLPDQEFNQLPREIRFMLRKVKTFQINLAELHEDRNPVEQFILRDLRFTRSMNVLDMARRVREYVGVSVEEQMNWHSLDDAFENWRDALENHGVFVFKDAFKNDFYSGFCLYDQSFPIIYLNNSVKTRQIFTLFHELAHLLFHTSGIDTRSDEISRNLSQDIRQIEIACNEFAAEFLLPNARFERDIQGLPPSEETAELLAIRYHVSREFIFRRFLDKGFITREEYQDAAQRWANQRQQGAGGNPYWTKISYLGTNYMNVAFSRYYQSKISESQLADYLDIKVKHLSKLENYFSHKIA